MLTTYLSGSEVVATITFTGEDGTELTANSAQYRVLDQNGQVIVALTAVPDFVAGSSDAAITVLAADNTLSETTVLLTGETVVNTRELRLIEVYAVTDAGTVSFEHAYIVEANNVLVEGVNSFQGYSSTLFRANNINKLEAWDAANKQQRVNALIRARENISRLRFKDAINLTELTSTEFVNLDAFFKDALSNAQVIEADSLLANDEAAGLIESGVMSMSVGEAKQFFRPTRPVSGHVCSRALRELSAWVVTTVGVVRG